MPICVKVYLYKMYASCSNNYRCNDISYISKQLLPQLRSIGQELNKYQYLLQYLLTSIMKFVS